jgi:peptidoglycan/xylan/chitin deacetylase (PgdA/CDA1 family)
MRRAGMAMGSHTHSHRILANLRADEQREECLQSREELAKRALAADLFSYPVGSANAFTPTTMEYAKEAGYRMAVSNYGGINLPGRMAPFDVRRLGMDRDENVQQLRLRLALASAARRQVW